MFFFTYTAAALAILFVIAAVLLFLKGNRNKLTYIFILYILASAVWIGGNAAADISKSDSMLILTSGVALAGATLIVTFFLIFVDTFVDKRLPSTTWMILYFLPSVLLIIYSFSDQAVLGTAFPLNQPAQIIPGYHYLFFALFLFGGLLYVLTKLSLLYRKETGKRRLQTLYITIGFIGLFFGGMTFNIILPMLGELRFYNVGPQFSLIFAVASGCAIFKYRLLDISRFVQRGLIYSFLLICTVAIYLISLSLVVVFVHLATQTAAIIGAGITTLIGIFTVPHIDIYLRRKTDKIFFKDRYDYAASLYNLSETIGRKLVLKDIVELAEAELQKLFKTESVSISIQNSKEIIFPSIIDERINFVSPTIYVYLNSQIIGSIHLAEKLSGDIYSYEDISLLKTFANQVAVSIENARLFKEVEDHALELEKRVEERTAKIRELQKLQQQLLLDISHNLQNPLTVVKNKLNTLEAYFPEKTELSQFEKSIDDVSSFVYDLLSFSRLEASKQIEKELFSLSQLVIEQTEYFEVVSLDQGIKLTCAVQENIFLYGDKEKCKQLLNNLVSNSVKYIGTHSRGKVIEITLTQENSSAVLKVKDNGIGIRANELPYIFDKFYRSNHGKNNIPGTGLGLAFVQTVVEMHGGNIFVSSKLDQGTTFTLTFPNVPN